MSVFRSNGSLFFASLRRRNANRSVEPRPVYYVGFLVQEKWEVAFRNITPYRLRNDIMEETLHLAKPQY